jgi:DNA-binding MarR family transcriptional regulator
MTADLSNSTLRALRRILRATESGSRKIAAATGMTPSQLMVLREIGTRTDATPGVVAQQLQFSHETITEIVDRLVALGLVTRTRNDKDKRQFLLDITPDGRRVIAEAPDLLQEDFSQRFAALPRWEQAMILAGTERLAAILGAENIDAAPLLDGGQIDRSVTRDTG